MLTKYVLPLAACLAGLTSCQQGDWHDASLPPSERAALILRQMTLEEKVGQMCQYVGPCYVPPGSGSAHTNIDADDESLGSPEMAEKIRRGEVGSFLHVLTVEEANGLQRLAAQSRLGIPLLLGIDAIHGNGLHSGCTIYPTGIGMASSFNPDLMEQIGMQTAREMRATGMAWTFAPNLDVARDARWGRMGETFGEDAYLVSEMGKAYIWGLQGRNGVEPGRVLACAKHFIAGGEPAGGLNAAPMDMSEAKMREIYLPPFDAAIHEAKVFSVMPAHNEVNGIPCHGNAWLLQDVLRQELGFDGFVVSDWMDIERLHSMHHWMPSVEEAYRKSVEVGIDLHMQGDGYFETIVEAVRSGRIPEKRINQAAGKLLEAKFLLGLFENAFTHIEETRHDIGTDEHRATALEAARQSIVLLKNDSLLPLDASKYHRIFVSGPNAHSQTILGDWVVPQPDEWVTTALEGIQQQCPQAQIDTMCFDGIINHISPELIRQATQKAAMADLNIVVLGENSERYAAMGRTCGENCDRDDLALAGLQQPLLEAVYASGKPTILVLLNGRALSTVWASEHVPAIIEAWEPGMYGGQAIAEVLFGKVNPSGKLPVTIPYSVGQVQTVYNHKFSQYSRQFVIVPSGCLYPFGFGLSYTTYHYGQPSLSATSITPAEQVQLTVPLTNDGSRQGTEVVQLYVRKEYASVTRPVKELKGFQRIDLAPGHTQEVTFNITPQMLRIFSANNKWEVEPGEYTIMVGSSSADADLQSVSLTVEP